ncbi:MAG TPA: CvpA family protein [bacterium]|nr:CvpA family protein [bacterium]HQG44881.1 CvpA family protein [bacterium]HQI49953.1 CvpA family protein [bacterium]HQJ63639.1 CvpA family protein [bacterium]
MSPFDLIIIAALIWFVYQGAKTGMAKELIGLTGWLIAVLVALKYGGWAGANAENLLPAIKAVPTRVSGFIIALLGTHLCFRVFGFMLRKLVGDKGQSFLDKAGGGVIGFVRGAFIISIIALAINSLELGPRFEDYQQRSSLFPHMSRFAQLVVDKVVAPERGARKSSDQDMSRQ